MLLETTIPTIITTPISDCTFSVVPVAYSVTSTPMRPIGTASRIMQRIDKRAELRHQNQVEQHHGQDQAEREAAERRAHPLHHAAQVDADARGKLGVAR